MGGAPSNISFQGFHARPGGFPLIVIDEAMGVDPTVFTAIDGITGWTQEWNSSNAVFLVAGHLSLHGTLTLEVHQNSGGR
jgi:hypothetical protein